MLYFVHEPLQSPKCVSNFLSVPQSWIATIKLFSALAVTSVCQNANTVSCWREKYCLLGAAMELMHWIEDSILLLVHRTVCANNSRPQLFNPDDWSINHALLLSNSKCIFCQLWNIKDKKNLQEMCNNQWRYFAELIECKYSLFYCTHEIWLQS